jgi:predicted amidophosphoribosyltransferase
MMKGGTDPEPPPCPYCREPLYSGPYICGRCGRDPSAPRRPCRMCGRVTPTSERACLSCGAVFKSDMRWKVPLIVALFLLSFVLSIAVALIKVLLG